MDYNILKRIKYLLNHTINVDNDSEDKDIYTLAVYSSFGSLIYLFFTFFFLIAGDYLSCITNLAGILLSFCIFIFIRFKFYLAGKLYALIIIPVYIIFFAIFYGEVIGVEYYILIFAMSAGFFFRKIFSIITFIIIELTFFISTKIIYLYCIPLYFHPSLKTAYFLNIIIAFSLLLVVPIILKRKLVSSLRLLNKKNNELEQLNQQRTNYFINLTHETKTPLTLITNYLNSYIKEYGTDRTLEIILENFENLKKNMINFLDYEKLVRNQSFYNHNQLTDLSGTLNNLTLLFKKTAALKNIELLITEIENDLVVQADPYAVNRIITNLLDNSIKYTDSGGKIEASLISDDDEIELKISDNGVGISGEALPHIFESYYQVSKQESNIQGIGMGLSIVKEILEDIVARIEVESVPEKGSLFKVYFKKYKGEDKSFISVTVNESINASKRINMDTLNGIKEDPEKRTILIIEDNKDMLLYLKHELSSFYNIITADNGIEALEKLSKIQDLALIISDIMMDKMDGLSLLNEINKDNLYKGIPFIFLTAKNTQIDKIKALEKGAVDFISKPFEISELRARIYSIIKFCDYQFERNKNMLIQRIMNIDNGNVEDKYFSLNFEKKCFENNISSREKQIILLLLEGKSNKDIGEEIFISISTVKYHIQKIYTKFSVKNRDELIDKFNI